MRSASYYYSGYEEERNQPYFLDFCSRCQRKIGQNSDIYMYRGNTAFCSQECRQEQIEMDEVNEKRRWKISSSKRSSSNTVLRQNKESTTKEYDTNKSVRTGTVAVA